MELIYLYIRDYRSLQDCGLDFDSNDRFEVKDGKINLVRKTIVPDGFFRLGKARGGRVESVSAIVGKNGSGKTSVAAFLHRCFMEGKEDLEFLYVLKSVPRNRKGQPKYLCFDNFLKPIEDISPRNQLGGNWHCEHFFARRVKAPPVSLFYYSPYYHSQSVFDAEAGAMIDLSTTGMIRNPDAKSLDEFQRLELRRAIEFIESNGADFADMSSSCPLPCPGMVTISGNEDLPVIAQKQCINRIEGLKERHHFTRMKPPFRRGTLHEMTEAERMNLLQGEFFDWKSHGGIARTLHYLEDALDFASIPDTFFKIAAGYMADRILRVDCAGDMLPKDIYALRLADIGYGVRNAIVEGAGESVRDEMPKDLIFSCWAKLSLSAVKRIRTTFVEQLEKLDLTAEERQSAASGEMIRGWHDHYVAIMRSVLDLLLAVDKCCGKGKEIKLSIRDRKQQAALYRFLSAHKERKAEDLRETGDSRFLRLNFVGLSSGEMAYLSLFSRLDEYLGREPKDLPSGQILKKDVILFLDEAETALHPDWQRRLVEMLIRYVESRTQKLNVHLIFASHSPNLLSDIPRGNVVFLERRAQGSSLLLDSADGTNTFAANAYDLYRSSFFLQDGPVGSFATEKIKEAFELAYVVATAKNKNGKTFPRAELEHVRQLVDLIGDRTIRKYFDGLEEVGLL